MPRRHVLQAGRARVRVSVSSGRSGVFQRYFHFPWCGEERRGRRDIHEPGSRNYFLCPPSQDGLVSTLIRRITQFLLPRLRIRSPGRSHRCISAFVRQQHSQYCPYRLNFSHELRRRRPSTSTAYANFTRYDFSHATLQNPPSIHLSMEHMKCVSSKSNIFWLVGSSTDTKLIFSNSQ